MLWLLLLAVGVDATSTGTTVYGASTLCFTLVRPGDQAKLLAQQFFEGIGIFACDNHMIFSSAPAEELFQPKQWGIKRWPNNGPLVYLVPGWQAEPDVNTMQKVWQQVSEIGLYKEYSWTLKMEPEVAFLTSTIHDVLTSHCSDRDCKAIFLANSASKIFSQVQALTRRAVEQLGNHADVCQDKVADDSPDAYLQDCLMLSGAKAVKEDKLLADFSHATVATVCNSSTGGFYPFAEWGQYMSCLGQAGYSVILDSPNNLAKVSWTRDVLLKGGYLRPTIFCWALVQHAGQEPKLMEWQRERGLGIFACDGWMVVSNASAREVLEGQAWHTDIVVVHEQTMVSKTFISKGGKLLPVIPNAGVFALAWQAVFTKGDFRKYDWTIKLDVDVAVVPERLREVLHARCGPSGCGKKMLQTFGGDLQGPVEAFSKEAAASFAAGFTSCTSVAGWNKQPESQWLSSCASTLGIAAERAPRLLSGYHEEVPRPCDTVHGLFHPFPQVDGMKQCLKQSGYYYIHAPATSTRTSITTRTTTTSSTITRTSSTATTSTMTYTIAKVAPDSIFNFERRSFQKQLPVWVITAENEHRGIPFAIGLATSLLLLFCIPIVGFFRTTPPAPVPGGTVLPRVAPEEIEDPLLRGP